jgi:DNA gyrase subunit A
VTQETPLPPSSTPPSDDVRQVKLEDEMRQSYLDYAMSVIVSRALPDVRDGLKPVHRRILYAMKESGNTHDKPYRKSANALGHVMMKYHPHGDAPIYEALVRMAQDFSLRVPLIDGQGNFGSMDGDPAAAFRYTEARLAKVATTLLTDIEKETVNFEPNFDGTTEEPSVLPARYPNLLVNGAGGIAVGMATNIPPHNLGEVLEACCAYIEDPEISVEGLMEYVQGPDFPTGGLIMGRSGLQEAYRSGKGSIVMRSRTHIESVGKDRQAIVVTEIPYQVNKARMVERIAELVNSKTIEGISDLRDESDRDGVRVVIELKRDADSDVTLNLLYRHSPLQTSFGANVLAIHDGRPVVMTLREIISAFVKFREEVVTRRTRFELSKARERAHILVGLGVAVANIDEVIALIRSASDPSIARQNLMAKEWPVGDIAPLIQLVEDNVTRLTDQKTYTLTEPQARAILELKLHRLTGLERDKIGDELKTIVDEIKDLVEILSSYPRLMSVIREEFEEVKAAYATPRRTEIQEGEIFADIEDLIQREDMVVTVSHRGYVKRVPLDTYRAQRRGGKGRSGMSTRDEDFVDEIFVSNTHTPVLFFSTGGMAFQMKVYRLPLGTPQSRGKAFVNLLPLQQDEAISTVLPLPDEFDPEKTHIMFATSKGGVRRNAISDFLKIKSNGKIAMKLEAGEKLVAVKVCTDDQDILLTTRQGKCIRFAVPDVRVFSGRTSTGVRGIRLAEGDEIISMSVLNHVDATTEEREDYLRNVARLRRDEDLVFESIDQERFNAWQEEEEFILSVTTKGMGKRTSAFEYRRTNRGGKGISNMVLTERTGDVVASFPVRVEDDLMLVTDGGQLIRTALEQVRVAGRMTQGVTLFRVKGDEQVVSVSRVPHEEESDEEGVIEETVAGEVSDQSSDAENASSEQEMTQELGGDSSGGEK